MVTSCGMTRTSHCALHLRARAEHHHHHHHNNNKKNKNKKNKHTNATKRCEARWLQAAVWKEHHTVHCTCAHAQGTWTTPTLTLLIHNPYGIPGVRSSTIYIMGKDMVISPFYRTPTFQLIRAFSSSCADATFFSHLCSNSSAVHQASPNTTDDAITCNYNIYWTV